MPRQAAGETILLVEDEEGVRAFSEEILTALGYRVICARDAAAALAIFDATPEIDMLFTDIVLTGRINGRQLAETITARRRGVVVLFTTGYARDGILPDGGPEEKPNLIGKPFTAAELGLKVGQLFETAGGRAILGAQD